MKLGLDVKHEGPEYGLTSRDIVDLAQTAERAGFESIWTNEDIGYDSIAVLAAASQGTRTICLGTAIVNVYNRSAMQLAMGAATLDELSGGRAILGLSVGHHPWNDLGHGIPMEAPLARLREYVAFIRKAVSGEPFRHDGPIFHGIDTRLAFIPVRPAIPIYVAGERPRIIRLAGEVADGLMINVVSAEYIGDFVAEHFRSSARAAGRDPGQLELTALVTCCVSEDRREALRNARATFGSRLRNALKMIETQPAHRHDELRYLDQLVSTGRREQAEEEASDELVLSVINAGSPADVMAGIERYAAAGCTRIIAVPYPRGRRDVERTISALTPLTAGLRAQARAGDPG